MPLDVKEMQNRTQNVVRENTYIDSPVKQTSYSISFLTLNANSIFITPEYSSSLNEYLSMSMRLIITSNPNYGPRIGSRYERTRSYTGPKKPGDFSFLESYILYSNDNLMVKGGKFSPSDASFSRFDIQSNYQTAPLYGYLYSFKKNRFIYSQGHYWIGYSSEEDTQQGYSRYYAKQKLLYLGKYTTYSIGDRVIYAGENQVINWRYNAPFEPFLVSVFNLGAPTNNDNHLIDFGLDYRNSKGLAIIAKIVIDEFQIDYKDRKTDDDDFGYQFSIIKNINNTTTSVAFNHMYSSDYLGIHYAIATNYEIMGIPILSKYGPQSKRSELLCNYELFKKKVIGWAAIYADSKGENEIIGTPWNPKASSNDKESWTDSFGFESEVLISVSQNYFGFIYMNLNNRDDPSFQIALAYKL